MAELNLKSSDKMDFDSAVEQISQLKSYVESTARELNINFNFNGRSNSYRVFYLLLVFS